MHIFLLYSVNPPGHLHALFKVFSHYLSLDAHLLLPLGLLKQISDIGVTLRYVSRRGCKALMQ